MTPEEGAEEKRADEGILTCEEAANKSEELSGSHKKWNPTWHHCNGGWAGFQEEEERYPQVESDTRERACVIWEEKFQGVVAVEHNAMSYTECVGMKVETVAYIFWEEVRPQSPEGK